MVIRENSTVKVIGGLYDGKTGKVVKVHDYIDIALVSFDDNGDVGKVPLSALVEVQPQADRIVDVKIVIPEGAKKITRADFDKAIVTATRPDFENPGDFMDAITHGLASGIVGGIAANKIFGDQDVVVMTRDDLVVALWDGCNPKNVNESSGFPIAKSLAISTGAIIALKKIVDILFGAENG